MGTVIENNSGTGAIIFKTIEEANEFLKSLYEENASHRLICFDTYFVVQFV